MVWWPPVVTLFSLLLCNCNFATVTNFNINIQVFWWTQVTPVEPEGGSRPQVENCYHRALFTTAKVGEPTKTSVKNRYGNIVWYIHLIQNPVLKDRKLWPVLEYGWDGNMLGYRTSHKRIFSFVQGTFPLSSVVTKGRHGQDFCLGKAEFQCGVRRGSLRWTVVMAVVWLSILTQLKMAETGRGCSWWTECRLACRNSVLILSPTLARPGDSGLWPQYPGVGRIRSSRSSSATYRVFEANLSYCETLCQQTNQKQKLTNSLSQNPNNQNTNNQTGLNMPDLSVTVSPASLPLRK